MSRNVTNLLERVYQASLRLLDAGTCAGVYKTIVDEAVNIAGAMDGSIFLEQNKKLKRIYTSYPLSYRIKPRRRANTYYTFKRREARIASIAGIKNAHPELYKRGVKWCVFIPLSFQENAVGVLILNTAREEAPAPEELKCLEYFGALASLAIRKNLLHEELEKALQIRDLFISMASHELRTPLTTISGYLQLLAQRKGRQNGKTQAWLAQISLEVARLTKLVSDLLTISKIKSGKLQLDLKEFYLSEAIKRAILDQKFSHPEYQITFKNSVKTKKDLVVGDFDKILHTVNNILDNAAKFSGAKDQISVTLKPNRKFLITRVKDKGKGIQKGDLPYVFTEFFRGSSDRAKGMGIGLYLARHIINEHRGEIEIKSKPKKGTIVSVYLPKAVYD